MPQSKKTSDSISTNPPGNGPIQLQPEIQRFLDTLSEQAKAFPPAQTITPVQARLNAELVRSHFTSEGPDMVRIEEIVIPYTQVGVKIRLYYPSDAPASPAFFYLHGGGWVLFSLDTHDRVMREYAKRANVCVIGIDYSLAPEHRYPSQIDEIVHSILWCMEHAKKLNIDPQKFAIGGDSAGANLSTASCLKLRSLGHPALIKALILNYGAFDARMVKRKLVPPNADEILLTSEEMIWFWESYLGDNNLVCNPLVSPVLAELTGLPPTFMAIAEYDILYQENMAMLSRFKASGISVDACVYQGTIHGFLESICYGGVAEQAFQDTALWLQKCLDLSPTDGHNT